MEYHTIFNSILIANMVNLQILFSTEKNENTINIQTKLKMYGGLRDLICFISPMYDNGCQAAIICAERTEVSQ